MNEKEEIRSTRWTFWIGALGLAGCIFSILFIIFWLLSTRQLKVEKPEVLGSYVPFSAQSITDLGFSSSGKLIAAAESASSSNIGSLLNICPKGPCVNVYTWDSDNRPSRKPEMILDFGNLTGQPALPRLIPMFTTGAPNGNRPIPAQAATGLPYSFSDDGSMIAWSWNGVLFAGPLKQPKKFRIPLTPPTPVLALSFFNKDIVGVIHLGGEFRLERLSHQDPNLWGTELVGAWRISGRGPFRVLSNFSEGDGMLLKAIPATESYTFPVNDTGTFITVSDQGRVAMGTNDGRIIFRQPSRKLPSENAPGISLPERRPVQALAFRDEKNLIVSTERGSLVLVEDEERATRLASAPRGVRLLAVDLSRIAMVTSNEIIVAGLNKRVVLDEKVRLWIAFTFYGLGLIGFFRVTFSDWYKLRVLKRDQASGGRRTSASPKEPPGSPPLSEEPLATSPSEGLGGGDREVSAPAHGNGMPADPEIRAKSEE